MGAIQERGPLWTVTLAILGTVAAATPALAQTASDPPADAPVQLEWLTLAPVLRLDNVGWDDNVFHVNKALGPTRDFTATLTPAMDAWLRLPRTKVNGRTQADFIYFQELTEIRSIDTDNSGRVELMLGRLRPSFGGHWANTRHRWNWEIDAPVRRLDSSWNAGVDVYVSKKTSVGIETRRSKVDYRGNTLYRDTDVAYYLDATNSSEGLTLRYALTPLTTVGFYAGRYRDEFARVPERNAEGVRTMSMVEFKPTALISGRAEVGIVRRTFVDGNAPPFRGLLTRIDLGYTLLGRTRFDVTANRDLSASYRDDQRDYVEAGVQLSVTHRLASAWDVRGTTGRYSLTYGLQNSPDLPAFSVTSGSERIFTYGAEIGYRVRRTRVGLEVTRQRRTSNLEVWRPYERTRITSSVRYIF